jgi:hypothetical protein
MTKNPFATVPDIIIPQLPITNFMPAAGEDFEAHGYVALPAIGTTAIVVSLPVPEGRHGLIKRIGNVFVGGGFQEGQGGVIWQILQDANVGPAAAPMVAPFFDNIVASLGSVNAPSTIDGIRIREAQLVQLIVKNVSIVVAGQFIGGRLGGYFYPVELDPETAGF